jgi:hypothetical protein
MGRPPFETGAIHVTVSDPAEVVFEAFAVGVAATPVGAPGTVGKAMLTVAGVPFPCELCSSTEIVYESPAVNPETVDVVEPKLGVEPGPALEPAGPLSTEVMT